MAQAPVSRRSVYERVTNQIIESIESGAATYEMPWHASGADVSIPRNAATGNRYRGVNVLALWMAAHASCYPENIWATLAQWNSLGHSVKRGEKATVAVFWKPAEAAPDDRTETQDEVEGSPRQQWIARAFSVFNAAQTSDYQLPQTEVLEPRRRIVRAEVFFGALNADIRHGGSKAYYKPLTDHVQMPPFEAFFDEIAYYSTLSHEVTHWTAHPSRLNRDLSGRFGTDSYAAEELVAELGSAFICADLAIELEPRLDHAGYIQSWLKLLSSDSRAIFTAAQQAQRAADFLHHLQP
ncbi:MAG: DUF1738 domain-containing protein [Armatimonadetes bacterium]|nr:DUF1738 domain-containing protein [Armatimonadota bacterium]